MKKDRKKIRMKRKTKQNKSKEITVIYPMMPKKYNFYERKKLRELEKELLKDKKVNIENNKVYKLERS